MNFETLDRILLEKKGKIIHQIWFDMGNGKQPSQEFVKNWKKINPEYYYHLWSENDSQELIKNYYNFFLSFYEKYPYTIQRIDAVRYFFLHRYGGFYCDVDFECLQPIKIMMKKYKKDLYLVESPNCIDELYDSISNCFMYSIPKHVFWKKVHKELVRRSMKNFYNRHFQIMMTTGPSMLTNVFQNYKDKFSLGVFPRKFFNPCGICDDRCIKTSKMFTVHRNNGSWENKDSRILKFLLCNWKLIICLICILTITYLI